MSTAKQVLIQIELIKIVPLLFIKLTKGIAIENSVLK